MSVVYFLERPSNGLVKIGRSGHFRSRLRNLEHEYGESLRILGIVDEDVFAEADLHRLFKDFRCQGEWFVNTRGIRDFIRRYAEPYDPKKHGGRANEKPVRLDRELVHRLSARAEREGLQLHQLLDRLVRGSLDP